MEKVRTCHDGHRQRLLDKFVKFGGESFENHEIMEMLLFYSIPRVNTNEIAHGLIERFGSIRGILDASIEELCQVHGIGLRSAELIKLTAELFARSANEKIDTKKQFTKYSQVCEYLSAQYIGISKEIVYLLVFNNAMRLIATEKIGEGNANSVAISSDMILKCAYQYNSTNIILAHNHPNGKALPSGDDLTTTGIVRNHLAAYGVRLIEHFVIAEGKCMPIIHGSKTDPKKEYEATVTAIFRSDEARLEGVENIIFEM